jgi:hypothetical protein
VNERITKRDKTGKKLKLECFTYLTSFKALSIRQCLVFLNKRISIHFLFGFAFSVRLMQSGRFMGNIRSY